jgi:DinB superfamily
VIAKQFLEYSHTRLLEQSWPRLRSLVESLNEDEIWWRPNEASNSIGNLMLHLNGNVQQWLISSFKHLQDERDRPAEFRQREVIPKSILLETLTITMNEASDVLASLSEADLLTTFKIQGYTVSGLHAVYQVVEHFGLHYGQIAYITKLLRGKDLGFYRELDATGRHPGP